MTYGLEDRYSIHLSYWGINGTPSENRTHDTAVKERGLNHLSMGAYLGELGFEDSAFISPT